MFSVPAGAFAAAEERLLFLQTKLLKRSVGIVFGRRLEGGHRRSGGLLGRLRGWRFALRRRIVRRSGGGLAIRGCGALRGLLVVAAVRGATAIRLLRSGGLSVIAALGRLLVVRTLTAGHVFGVAALRCHAVVVARSAEQLHVFGS